MDTKRIINPTMESIARIVVLPDGETFSELGGCKVVELPHSDLFDVEDIEEMLTKSEPRGFKSWDIAELIRENEELKEKCERFRVRNCDRMEELVKALSPWKKNHRDHKRILEAIGELKEENKKLRKWEDYPNVDLIHPRAIAIASGEDPKEYMDECSAESLGRMIKENKELKKQNENFIELISNIVRLEVVQECQEREKAESAK